MRMLSRSRSILFTVLTFFSLPLSLLAASSWRGPARDGVYSDETNLLKSWPAQGPKLVLTLTGIGSGYSSPTVFGDRIYVSGMIDKTGYLFAFDTKGSLLWKTAYAPEWSNLYPMSFPGVRGSPTADGSHVFIQSGPGHVVCLNAADGKVVWSVDMLNEFGVIKPYWGHAETMILFEGKLICTPGGTKASVAALDTATGKTLWSVKAGEEKAAYCSPILVTYESKPLFVTMLEKSVIGIDPASATLLWKFTTETTSGVQANTPLYQNGSIIYASSDSKGKDKGAGMIKLSADGKSVIKVWISKKFDPAIGGIVLLDNKVYGFGAANKGLHSLDMNTGTIVHTLKQNKGGVVIAADGMLYCYNEEGTVFLVKPEESGITMVSSFKIDKGKGPYWAHPVINSGKLFVRHGEFVFVYEIAK
jgi:outer membrane protein assembly factor BamB